MKKKKLIITLLVINFLLLGTDATLSAYRAQKEGTASLKVASIIFNNEEVESASIDLQGMSPGETKEINFKVANNLSGKKSEVNVNYTLTLRSYHVIPTVMEIYTSSNTLILSCDENTATRSSEGYYECTTDPIELAYNENKEDSYKVKISLPDNLDEKYARQSDFIEVLIDSWQKEEE